MIDNDNLKCTGCGNYIKSCTCNCCTHTAPKRKFVIGGKIYWLCSKCEDKGEE